MKKKTLTVMSILVVILILIPVYMLLFRKHRMADIVNLDDISEISIITQMTDPPKELNVSESECKGLIDVLKGYTLKRLHREIPKGWQYRFEIKMKNGESISILFQGSGRVVINDKYYNVYGYSPDDFLYLFENK